MDIKQLTKNPVQYLLGICIVVIGYLYNDMRTDMDEQKTYFLNEIAVLKAENKELTNKYIELAKSINK